MTLEDLYRGSTYSFDVTIKLDGVAADLTGDTVEFRLKHRLHSNRHTFEADMSEAATGKALFRLTPEQTTIRIGNYAYQIVWTRQDGSVYVPLEGALTVLAQIEVS